jgi:peptidyl-prolyl cis-trans isomerase D
MLQQIRDNLQGMIAKAIIVLIAIPFALVGIDAFFGGGEPKVARVDGEAIKKSDLDLAVELQRRRVLSEMGENIDPAALEEGKLRSASLDTLIDRTLMQRVARQSGIRVSDAMLDAVIAGNPAFQEEGKFSQARYQAILANNGLNPAVQRKLLREDLLIAQVFDGLQGSEFVTDRELADVARITQQSVDVRYLIVPHSKGDAPVVPEAEIEKEYADNKDAYRTAETISVDYLELKLEDLFVPIAEDELRAEFQRRVAAFAGKEERHAAHILLTDLSDNEARTRLSALREQLLAGGDFAALAKANSSDSGSAENGGDLGYSSGDIFPEAFEKALAELKPGEYSQPVKTDFGWHLIKLLDSRRQQAPQFEEVRAEIERELQLRMAEPRFVEASEKLADSTFNSEGLDEAATELKLEKKTSAEFGREGGDGLFADKRLIEAAFSKEVLDEAQNSEVVEIGKEHVVVLRLKQHHPARQRELAEVRAQIQEKLQQQLMQRLAQQAAEQVLARVRAGSSIEEVARADSYEWQVALEHHRGGAELESDFSAAVFSLPRAGADSTYGTFARKDGAVFVFEVSRFREGDVARYSKEEQQALRQVFLQARTREIMNSYKTQLRADADVEML